MSLEQNAKKIKPQPETNPVNEFESSYLFFGLVGLMSGLLIWLIWQLLLLNNSYNLSNQSVFIEKSHRVGEINKEESATNPTTTKTYFKNFYIAASKSGTKYYYQNCVGLNRIKPENLIFFASESLAERAGYTLAKNCQKLEK
jgi:hypothetical protein